MVVRHVTCDPLVCLSVIFFGLNLVSSSHGRGNALRHSMSSSIIATVWACCEKMCENINVTSMFIIIVLKPDWTSRRVWRYQRGNQNLYIDDEPTTQWPKEKVQKDKQRSTKHTHKTNDRVTRTPIKTRGELRCSGRIRHLFYKFAFFLSEEMSRPSHNKFSIVINDLTL